MCYAYAPSTSEWCQHECDWAKWRIAETTSIAQLFYDVDATIDIYIYILIDKFCATAMMIIKNYSRCLKSKWKQLIIRFDRFSAMLEWKSIEAITAISFCIFSVNPIEWSNQYDHPITHYNLKTRKEISRIFERKKKTILVAICLMTIQIVNNGHSTRRRQSDILYYIHLCGIIIHENQSSEAKYQAKASEETAHTQARIQARRTGTRRSRPFW